MTAESSLPVPCPRCEGTGKLRRTLRLVVGRGANFYRTGAYARSVQVVGPKPGDPCPACAGTGDGRSIHELADALGRALAEHDRLMRAAPPARRQPRRCECGEVARYRYSGGLSEHLTCSDCSEPGSGWDGPWHLCDTCGDDCDPRDGFRCPACRQRVGAPEEDA
ncbi:MAG: hypothetical protein KGK07_16265 [Chloroflexota bacterium]|nr:hypothetical protein [Chloroflexota bacterium]